MIIMNLFIIYNYFLRSFFKVVYQYHTTLVWGMCLGDIYHLSVFVFVLFFVLVSSWSLKGVLGHENNTFVGRGKETRL